MVLDQQTRDPQVRNGNDAVWIAALGGRASDSVWPRFNLFVDRTRRAAPDQQKQRYQRRVETHTILREEIEGMVSSVFLLIALFRQQMAPISMPLWS